MAKRKKKGKKSKGPTPLITKKKIKKLLFRLVLVGIGAGVGVMARPSVIQDPVKRAQVEGIRDQILNANDEAQEKALDVLGTTSEKVKEGVDKASDIAEDVTNKDPQEVVEDAVDNLKEEVKTLPEKQIKKIKLEFCQDVIEEIELTCEE